MAFAVWGVDGLFGQFPEDASRVCGMLASVSSLKTPVVEMHTSEVWGDEWHQNLGGTPACV